MKTVKEEKLVEVTYYVCDFCDYKNEYRSNIDYHLCGHIQKNNIGNTIAYFVENEVQLRFLKERLGGEWSNQPLPNWFVYYEETNYDTWVSITYYINQLNCDIKDLKDKADSIEKHKQDIINFAAEKNVSN